MALALLAKLTQQGKERLLSVLPELSPWMGDSVGL